MLEKPLLDMIMIYAFFSGIILIPLAIVSALYDTFKLRLRPDTLAKEELTPFQKGEDNPLVKKNHAPAQTVQTEKVEAQVETEPWSYEPDSPDFLKEIRRPPEPETEVVEIPVTEEKPEQPTQPTPQKTENLPKGFNWNDYEIVKNGTEGAIKVKILSEAKFFEKGINIAQLVEQEVWVKKKQGLEEESDLTGPF